MTILAAVSGEKKPDPVVATGADLAEAFDEELVLVHVMSEETFETHQENMQEAEDSVEFSINQAEGLAEQTAQEVYEATLGEGPCSTVGRVGSVVVELLDVAEELDPRFMVIGGRKRTPVGKAIFGSNTQSILLESEKPVVTVMSDD